ncbi:hypothetical protein AAVH_30617, partial [Aphelenchoides avenae]
VLLFLRVAALRALYFDLALALSIKVLLAMHVALMALIVLPSLVLLLVHVTLLAMSVELLAVEMLVTLETRVPGNRGNPAVFRAAFVLKMLSALLSVKVKLSVQVTLILVRHGYRCACHQ